MSINLVDEIAKHYPEISGENQKFWGAPNPKIDLRDDSDGYGVYIYAWNYDKPIPEELKQYLGKQK